MGTGPNPLPQYVTLDMERTPYPLILSSGVATNAGATVCVTPPSGGKLRLYYVAYNPVIGRVRAAFRFGASGPEFLRFEVPKDSVIAKDFGDFRFVEGGVDEPLMILLDRSGDVLWNVFYRTVQGD